MPLRKLLENIRIVLIHTSHPGNIGSAARAMKTMGLSDLCLVNPKSFPDEQASIMASSAKDILAHTHVVETLEEAIADCHWVIGTSARYERSLAWSLLEPRACGEKVVDEANQNGRVALLFGRENSGLTNDELAHCNQLVHIPANAEYSSLNIASAVQILAYECRLAALQGLSTEQNNTIDVVTNESNLDEIVTASELEHYYQYLEKVMIATDFLDPEKPKLLMTRLRRLYGRAGVTRSELKLLYGMLAAFEKR